MILVSGSRVHCLQLASAKPWSSFNGILWTVYLEPSSASGHASKHLQVEPRVGGTFSIYGGSVEAKFTALEPPSQIAMDWRFKNWPDNTKSKVLKLCSRNLPSSCIPVIHAVSSSCVHNLYTACIAAGDLDQLMRLVCQHAAYLLSNAAALVRTLCRWM